MKIGLQDLKEETYYVDIDHKFKIELKNQILEKYKTLSNFCRELRLPIDKISRNNDLIHFFKGHKIKLSFLLKILEPFPKLNSLKAIEKNIFKIGCRRGNLELYSPKIPFKFDNVNGVRLISALLHDGGIIKEGIPFYKNNSEKLRNLVIESAYSIFGNFKYRAYKNGTLIVFPKILGTILSEVGLKAGAKVYNDPSVPEFIFSLNPKLKSVFLQQAFDDEGSIGKYQINISLHVDVTSREKNHIPRLLVDDRKLIEDLGIKCTQPKVTRRYFIEKDNSKFERERWTLILSGKANLEKFQEKINFQLEYKKKKLERLISSYKVKKTWSKNEVYLMACEKAAELTRVQNDFTISSLSQQIKRDYHYTKRFIWRMENENKLLRIERARGHYPAKFRFLTSV